MKITSPEFRNNQSIPVKFTCQGKGVNPALIITDIPLAAKSLVLFMDDPDAPSGNFVHWVVYDIPVIGRIQENSVPGKQGSNDGGGIHYVSPCPPSGIHRYFFKIYALDKLFNWDEGISKPSLESAMLGHILDQAELMGLYNKG
ncbi:MAG: YbhB/YbcL family Raf kinase inhibitor-like protein [Candidatus Omnitrophota bacterium]